MPSNPLISQSLIQLSDAIEQLAMILAEQKHLDNDVRVKELSVLVNKFSKQTQQIQSPKPKNWKQKIKAAHQQGYLKQWLLQKGITAGTYKDNLHVNSKLYTLADYLADHYTKLRPFYEQLKKHQVLKRDFEISTSKKSIKYIRQWCNMLHRNKIIDAFQFLDNSKMIDVDIAEIHNATSFINGNWLEIFLRREIAIVLRKNLDKIKSFDILAQVEITKPSTQSSELDVLIMLNGKIYWFECKSGNIGSTYYNRFREHRVLMQLPTQQSLLVVPMMQQHQARLARKNSGMTMLHGTNLNKQLQKLLF